MKRVSVKLEFVLRDENGLYDLDSKDLITEICDCLEDERAGVAEYKSVIMRDITVQHQADSQEV